MRISFSNIFILDAYAHCDIPCGIYDPHGAQMAAHTVIRMIHLLSEVDRADEVKAEHDIARMTHVKEEHGHIVEDELGTLENDYFKPEHYEKFPELKGLLEEGVKLSINVRQHVDMDAANKLLEIVMKIAEIFYKTKGLESVRVKAPYPTGFDIVVQK
ncbi:MAG: superoxide dismutase, Ni [Candidatus Levyibacteriota bacterium]